jgi:serpin B
MEKNNETGEILKAMLLSNNESLDNRVCSPISFLIFLDIISTYDNNLLEEEIVELLDGFGYSRSDFYAVLQHLEDSDTKLLVASSFWYGEDEVVEDINYPYFKTFRTDFSHNGVKKRINKWVSSNTNGLIKKLDLPLPTENQVELLISTLYFKSLWLNTFQSPPYPSPFEKLDGEIIQVGYLGRSNEEPISYVNTAEYKAIAIDYKDNDIQFEAYLPNEKEEFRDFILNLDKIDWKSIHTEFKETSSYAIAFPKFEITSEIDLEDVFKETSIANLSEYNFTTGKYLERGGNIIKQNNVIKVNEKGTEVASTTYGMMIGSIPVFDVEFVANRPFVFIIREKKSNAILFMGIVSEPSVFKKSNKLWGIVKSLFRSFSKY